MMQQVKDSFTRPVIAYTMSCIKDDILEEINKKKATKIYHVSLITIWNILLLHKLCQQD